jgi:hypothetical protein
MNRPLNIASVPVANAGEDILTHAGEQIQLEGSVIDPDPVDTHSFTWDFGDGNTADGQNVSHTYSQKNSIDLNDVDLNTHYTSRQ